MKILVLEDNNADWELLEDNISDYNNSSQNIRIEAERMYDNNTFSKKLCSDPSLDAAIFDLRIETSTGAVEEGNTSLKDMSAFLEEKDLFIPMAVYTNLIDRAPAETFLLKSFLKGKPGFADMMKHLSGIYLTGITEITGNKGLFTKTLKDTFSNNILPILPKWTKDIQLNPDCSKDVKTALIRYTFANMLHVLNKENPPYKCEEFFIYPSLGDIRTGSIIKSVEGDFFCVITPTCDLVSKNPSCINILKILNPIPINWGDQDKDNARENKYSNYYHYIPAAMGFTESLIDFRKTFCTKIKDIGESKRYVHTKYQISPDFVKDIQSRFSAYYGRQGQPNLEIKR